ncbi:WhiB family transcriptional regulator [Streptomyces sp. NPDC087908]|uniref:WhiB family transcriptional regulator n=1 Tax=Streptomyces sp. NPDC087908 TaxID=3365820 RepID=UPI003819D810
MSLNVSREWKRDGACVSPGVDPDIFFAPPDGRKNWDKAAKLLCRVCPVKKDCLITAIEDGEMHGVWGGLNGSERLQFYVGNAPPQ